MYQGGRRKRKNDYLRSCDFCGRLVLRSSMFKKDNFLACKDDKKGRERITLDKANAQQLTPQTWRPAKNRRSDADSQIDVYQADEAVAFNDICVTSCVGEDGVFRAGLAPYEIIDITGNGPGTPLSSTTAATETPRCAGWSIDYLYGVLVENKRPQTWLDNAESTIVRLADWLLAHQFKTDGAGDYATATTTAWFGGFPRTGVAAATATLYAEDQGIGLLGLLRAYQTSGNIQYLLGARRVATCIRRLQCGGLRTTGYLVANASSSIWLPSMPSTSLTVSRSVGVFATSVPSVYIYPRDLICIEALALLKSVDSDATYGDTTAVGEFASATDATVTNMIAQARAFWSLDWMDTDFVPKQGFSATTPREFYQLSLSTSPTAAEWGYAYETDTVGYVTSLNFAGGLRSLHATEGLSSLVTTVYAWLVGLANPDYGTPTDYSPKEIAQTTFGTYSATIAPPAEIAVPLDGSTPTVGAYYTAPMGAGPTDDDGAAFLPGPTYDLGAAGLLSGIRGATSPSSIKLLKDALAPKRNRDWITTATSILAAS